MKQENTTYLQEKLRDMVPDEEQTLDLPGKDFTSTISNTFKGLEKTGRRTYEQIEDFNRDKNYEKDSDKF